jgi:electron transport complex protein RnfG
MSNATASKPSTLATIKPVIVLVAICVVAGVLLGAVHYVTQPIADAIAEERAQATYAALVPEAASFESLDCTVEGCTAALAAQDASGNAIGYVIVAQSKGYGGQVPIAVAFDLDGNVTSITAMANGETPGLGTRVSEDEHIKQYVGLPPKLVAEEEINFISGATISSRAVHEAFNYAVQAYEEVR